MARKSRTASSATSSNPAKRRRKPIPESFRIVSSASVTAGAANVKVPMLVLCGEWLKTIGFPIGSAAYLISDQQGELALRRVGLRVPRKLLIRSTPV